MSNNSSYVTNGWEKQNVLLSCQNDNQISLACRSTLQTFYRNSTPVLRRFKLQLKTGQPGQGLTDKDFVIKFSCLGISNASLPS